MLILILVFMLAVFGLVAVQYAKQPDPDELLHPPPDPSAKTTFIQDWRANFTWSHYHSTLETALYWLMVSLLPLLIWADISGWASLAYYISTVKENFSDPVMWQSSHSPGIIINVILRVFLIYSILSMAYTGFMIVNWPHGVARFVGGRKWRSMQPGICI